MPWMLPSNSSHSSLSDASAGPAADASLLNASAPTSLDVKSLQFAGGKGLSKGGLSKRTVQGIAAGLLAGALWGLVFVAPRMVGNMAASDIAMLRFVSFAAMSVGLLIWQAGQRQVGVNLWPEKHQWLPVLAFSMLGFSGYYWILALSIQGAGSALPSLIVGLIPLWVMLLGKPAHLLWRHLAMGLGLTLAGLLVMGWPEVREAWQASWLSGANTEGASTLAQRGRFGWGIGLAVLAMACWTAFSLLNSRYLQQSKGIDAAIWTCWLGMAAGAVSVVVWALGGGSVRGLIANPQWPFAVAVCVAMGVLSSWVAQWLWNIASQRLPASLCGQLIVSETVFALLYAFLWDGAWPTPAQCLAMLLFTIGIVLSIRAHR